MQITMFDHGLFSLNGMDDLWETNPDVKLTMIDHQQHESGHDEKFLAKMTHLPCCSKWHAIAQTLIVRRSQSLDKLDSHAVSSQNRMSRTYTRRISAS